MTDGESSTNAHRMAVFLPEGWGWLQPEPSLLRDTLEAVIPADVDPRTHEQLVVKAIDEALAMQTVLAPWQAAGIAAWSEQATIGGIEETLSASLLLAMLPLGSDVAPEEILAGVAGSSLRGSVVDVVEVTLGGRRAVRLQGRWAGPGEESAAQSWIYLLAVEEIESLVMLLFATPDIPDWESFGQLFDAIAGTFDVWVEDEPLPEVITLS